MQLHEGLPGAVLPKDSTNVPVVRFVFCGHCTFLTFHLLLNRFPLRHGDLRHLDWRIQPSLQGIICMFILLNRITLVLIFIPGLEVGLQVLR